MPMNLDELQDTIVGQLRPNMQRLAAVRPEFVQSAVRRLVLRVPDKYPSNFFDDPSDTEDFAAGLMLEAASDRRFALSSIWVTILLQILLPALIRVFLLWWSHSESHRQSLRHLRDNLAEGSV